MSAQPSDKRQNPTRGLNRTTLRWLGLGPSPLVEGIQSGTVDPDRTSASEGAPEWLVTNGLGGYASGTVTGIISRRFHGDLVAALPAPRGRTMMLNHLSTTISTDQGNSRLSEEQAGASDVPMASLREFRLELGLPVWTWEHEGHVIEKRIMLPHRQNTVLITFKRLGGAGSLRISFQPWVNFRPHEGEVSGLIANRYALRVSGGHYEIEDMLDATLPLLRMKVEGARAMFLLGEQNIRNVKYLIEQSRGYDASGDLYSPGTFYVDL